MIKERDEQISKLIFKQITGTITAEEKLLLNDWRNENVKHEQLYNRLLDTKMQEMVYRQRKAVNVKRPMLEMQKRIEARNHKSQRYELWKWAVAASIVIVFGLSIIKIWNNVQSVSKENILASSELTIKNEIKPGETKAFFKAADGEEILLGADDNINKKTIREHHLQPHQQNETVSQLCLNVPRGGEFKIILEDGSEVWLNSESELIYPESFSKEERRVIVKGEAYFKIAKEEERPFFVETEGQLVRVYGTEFNIRSYNEDEEIYTTLVSGSIGLSKMDGKSGRLMLTPGHQAQFSKEDEEMSVKPVNTEIVTSWRHGRFVFEEQNLEQIMTELSRWYSFDYQFEDESLKHIVFMGSIPRYSEFDTTLAILEKSGGLFTVVTTITPDAPREP